MAETRRKFDADFKKAREPGINLQEGPGARDQRGHARQLGCAANARRSPCVKAIDSRCRAEDSALPQEPDLPEQRRCLRVSGVRRPTGSCTRLSVRRAARQPAATYI
jgi:hypothetical protein